MNVGKRGRHSTFQFGDASACGDVMRDVMRDVGALLTFVKGDPLFPTSNYSNPAIQDGARFRKCFPLTAASERRTRPFRQRDGRAILSMEGAAESAGGGVPETRCGTRRP